MNFFSKIYSVFSQGKEPMIRVIESASKSLIEKAESKGQVSDDANFYAKARLAQGRIANQWDRFLREYWSRFEKTVRLIETCSRVEFSEISNYVKAKDHLRLKKQFFEVGKEQFFIQHRRFADRFNSNKEDVDESDRNKKIEEVFNKELLKIGDSYPTGVSDSWAMSVISEFERKVAGELLFVFNDELFRMLEFVNHKRFESGLISESVYDELLEKDQYFFLFRDWTTGGNLVERNFEQLNFNKRHENGFNDPIEHLLNAAKEAIVQGERNRVNVSVLEFAKRNPDSNLFSIRTMHYLNSGMKCDESGRDVWFETDNHPTKDQRESGKVVRVYEPMVSRRLVPFCESDKVISAFIKGQRVIVRFVEDTIPKELDQIFNGLGVWKDV